MEASARTSRSPEIVVIGSGPNGLTAAVLLARAGLSVEVVEAATRPGGGCRSAALTLPGFVHDICSAVHPMGALSPAFREIDLERFGLEWVSSKRPLAHPLPDGSVAVLERSLEATAGGLGGDGAAWRRLMRPLARDAAIHAFLGPVWFANGGHWLARARFGRHGMRSAESLARSWFQDEAARALFAGCAAHASWPLDRAGTAAFGLMLAAAAHARDWPCARGGSQSIATALARALEACGGRLQLRCRVKDLRAFSGARAILFDVDPGQMAAIAGEALPSGYRARLLRYRRGPGVFKIDWALAAPIPWRNPECAAAMTVHVGGSFEEVLRSEAEVRRGGWAERPFVLVAQQSGVDLTRAPAGRQTGWAYCHVPNGCAEDMTTRIEAQVERFAPGFRDTILARHTLSPAQLEAHNPAMPGGDMGGGRNDLRQFLFRPVVRWNPYTTPNPRLFLCSSATPPGGGVHGMGGWHAAHAVLRRLGQR